MKVLIYFELISQAGGYSFNKPFLKWFKNEYPEVSILDLDQHSDQSLFKYAQKAFDEAEQVILVIDGSSDIEVENIALLNQAAINHAKKTFSLLRFESSLLKKIFSVLGKKNFLFSEDPEEQKKFITDVMQYQK